MPHFATLRFTRNCTETYFYKSKR